MTSGNIRLRSAPGRWVLLTTVLGSGMATLDGTVVNVALPALGRDLHAGMSGLQWTVNAYTLTMAALILLGGSLGDRLGRRKIFVAGVVWFALASALCGAAPNTSVLVLARALQGIGGALLIPGSLAIIQASYAPDDRPRAVGAWSGLGGVAAALGPLLGGWLVETAGWRWVFLLNLPLAAVVVGVAARHVPETRAAGPHGRFDVLGTVLAAPALAGLTYGLILAGDGLLPLAAGLVLAACFVVVEIRRSPGPSFPWACSPRASSPRSTSSRWSCTRRWAWCSSCWSSSSRCRPACLPSPPGRRCSRSRSSCCCCRPGPVNWRSGWAPASP
ncbi:hypothetical protein GCM10027612_55550 [Microbispora bryophytorum subsp. camponoti]